MLGIQKQLHAEAAAHIRRHDADAVLWDLQDMLGEQAAHKMRALRRTPQRISILARIVFADRTAHLHRIDDDAVVDERQRDAVTSRPDSALHRPSLADLPFEAAIAGVLVPYSRLTRIERVCRV